MRLLGDGGAVGSGGGIPVKLGESKSEMAGRMERTVAGMKDMCREVGANLAPDVVGEMLDELLDLHQEVLENETFHLLRKIHDLRQQMERLETDFSRERMKLEEEYYKYRREKEAEMGRLIAENMMKQEEELSKLVLEKRKQEEEFSVLMLKIEEENGKKEDDMKKTFEEMKSKGKSTESFMALPSFWFPFTDEDYAESKGHQFVMLDELTEEYSKINRKFRDGGCSEASWKVVSIERVQSPFLYRAYQFHRVEMTNTLKRVDFDGEIERMLFHGTDYKLKETIATQGFDWRLCGKNGTAYGKGNYFALQSSYSSADTYCVPGPDGLKVMFVSFVLVGRYAQGSSAVVRPPVAPDGVLYDSVVDNLASPKIFVSFDNWNSYPAYAVTFKKRS